MSPGSVSRTFGHTGYAGRCDEPAAHVRQDLQERLSHTRLSSDTIFAHHDVDDTPSIPPRTYCSEGTVWYWAFENSDPWRDLGVSWWILPAPVN